MEKEQVSVMCVLRYGASAHRPNTAVDHEHGACMMQTEAGVHSALLLCVCYNGHHMLE